MICSSVDPLIMYTLEVSVSGDRDDITTLGVSTHYV